MKRFARAESRGRRCSRSAASRDSTRSRPGSTSSPPMQSRRGHRRALAEIDAGLAAKPDHAPLLYHRACINAKAGRLDEARVELDRARLELDPAQKRWPTRIEDLASYAPPGRLPPARAGGADGIGLRPRDDEHGAVAVAASRRGEPSPSASANACEPARRRTARARRGWLRGARSLRDGAHRDVGDERRPSELGIASAMVRPGERSPPPGGDEPARSRSARRRGRPPRAGGRTSRASRSQFEATTTRARVGGRELRLDDRGEGEVAEGAVAVPALVPRLTWRRRGRASGLRSGSVSSQSMRERPCPSFPRDSASRKWSASLAASASEKPSAARRSSGRTPSCGPDRGARADEQRDTEERGRIDAVAPPRREGGPLSTPPADGGARSRAAAGPG